MPTQAIAEAPSRRLAPAQTPRASGSKLLTLTLPALATGGLLWMCHFPLAWGWLGWVALVPLLSLVRSTAKARWVYLSAWAGGLAFFVPVLQWMRVADDRMYLTWLGLALCCSLFFTLAFFLIRRLDRATPLSLTLSVPIAWTAVEFLRGNFLGGFPWYFLAHTQHDFTTLIQISDITGAYGVTFLVAAVNGLLFEVLFRFRPLRRLFDPTEFARVGSVLGIVTQAVFVLILLCGALGYGAYRVSEPPGYVALPLVVVQTNVEQGIRNARDSGSDNERTQAVETMGVQHEKLRVLAAQDRPQLIIWPETSHVEEWLELSENFSLHERSVALDRENAKVLQEAKDGGSDVLFGFNALVVVSRDHARRYNSAVLVNKEGRFVDRYDKIHRVPFGEYVPFVDTLPWMKVFSPYGSLDYSVRPGERFTRFPTGDHHFGVVICFEDTDPALARQYAGGDGGPPVDFLVNISNDGWFRGTSEHEEHLAISRFRAVECRRTLVRSVNMGISGVILSNGRVADLHSLRGNEQDGFLWGASWGHTNTVVELPVRSWADHKKVKGVLRGLIAIDHRTSWYARLGDWLPSACWLIVAGGLAMAVARRLLPREVRPQ
jgi:apolipoprotein N-acyltransferase